MRVGVICGDRWHPADVIMQGLSPFERKSQDGPPSASNIELDYVLDTIEWSNENLAQYDVVILAKGNSRSATDWEPWLTEDVQKAFVSFVECGGGLLVIHSGTVGYKDEHLFRGLVGGVFDHHPVPCAVTVQTMANDTIPSIGVRTFEVHDEHYFMEIFDDSLNVFMISESMNGIQPAGWTRQQGKGRVCVLTPGHFAPVWQDADYHSTIAAALNWCAGGE